MDLLITWLHYAATFFLSLGIVLFVRFIFSFSRFSPDQRETRVYLPAFGFFFLATSAESVFCYFSGREDDFQTMAALAAIPFVLFVCYSAKSIRRKLAKREGDGTT